MREQWIIRFYHSPVRDSSSSAALKALGEIEKKTPKSASRERFEKFSNIFFLSAARVLSAQQQREFLLRESSWFNFFSPFLSRCQHEMRFLVWRRKQQQQSLHEQQLYSTFLLEPNLAIGERWNWRIKRLAYATYEDVYSKDFTRAMRALIWR